MQLSILPFCDYSDGGHDDDEECCLRCLFLVGTVIPVVSAPTPFPLLSTKSVRESHVVVESHSPAIESVTYLRSQVFLTPELAQTSVARLSFNRNLPQLRSKAKSWATLAFCSSHPPTPMSLKITNFWSSSLLL
jgi:hypothetical protein